MLFDQTFGASVPFPGSMIGAAVPGPFPGTSKEFAVLRRFVLLLADGRFASYAPEVISDFVFAGY
jgi:hypothetical protein